MRIVFMGTPDFALYSLKALCESEHEVIAVVTQPDKPGNRGVTVFSPVKKHALSLGIPVLQYGKIRTEGYEDLKKLGADIFVTAAFGQIISKEIIDLPSYGIINVHASLLPKYRGSSPIQWAVINGEKKTGVTIMKTAEGLDTGDILYAKELEILETDTAGSLFDKLGNLGSTALIEYLKLLENGTAPIPIKQDESQASYYPMLKKSDGLIDWKMNAQDIINKIKGVTPWPGAFTQLNGKTIKIHLAEVCDLCGRSGEVLSSNKNGLVVGCADKSIRLLELQAEGKKRMNYVDFLNGNKIVCGECFS